MQQNTLETSVKKLVCLFETVNNVQQLLKNMSNTGICTGVSCNSSCTIFGYIVISVG